MGSSNNNYNNVNKLAQSSAANYQGQRNDFSNVLYSGLGTAQSNSQRAFNTALGGYTSLANALKGGGFPGGGGGGGGLASSIAAIQGLSGPGNPWAGQLGMDVRARENSVLPAFFDQVKAAQERLQNIQGGYNPGYTAQMSKLTRDQAHNAQEGVLNTEIELGQRSAAAEAASAAFDMQKQGMIASLQAQASGAASANARAAAAMRLSALGGITALRGQTPGEVAMYLSGLGNNLNAGQAGANSSYGNLMAYNPKQPSTFDRILGTVGAVAPVAGMIAGGGSGKGGGNRNNLTRNNKP